MAPSRPWGGSTRTRLLVFLVNLWLGEQITERGIGNGVSVIIMVGIIADLPAAARWLLIMFFPPDPSQRKFNLFHAIALVLLLFAVIAGVIAVTQAQRKIPVQYAQRAVGRRRSPRRLRAGPGDVVP